MKFEFYVINYNFNKREAEMFNIFNNYLVQQRTEDAIRKYLRAPNKYEYKTYFKDEPVSYGFTALCKMIERIIMHEEWGRCEYEISAGDKFEKDCNNLKAFDCYEQAKPNIEIITRECIFQYKKQLKEEKKKGEE